ncbi:glycosyltransferase family 4 protein [Planotetraspora kaengkrachanensis]|uniref:Glycosyl transferase n=1 Tax=Planotetraspora kaengkrachanensis TaxID=575193 RepID=A0A8J3LU78_9ACTN|nr:glycosyl transferase [Planotetraspora kaengkrachanensis]
MSTAGVFAVLPGDVDDEAAPSGGNVYDRRVCRELAAAGLPVHEIAVRGAWPRPDADARAALARSLAEVPSDAVVLLDGLVACGVPDVVVPQAGRLRLAVLVHLPLGDEIGPEPGAAADLDARERATLQAAGAVVATSPWTAKRLAGHHGLAEDRIHVVSPGADRAPAASGTDGASRLLCVGSVTPTKGHDLLVEALAAVREPSWHCEIVGPLSRDPAHAERLRRTVGRLGLGDRVRLAGPLTAERLAEQYARADLVVLPSRSETYGMVVTEALARGIPVLATAVGGVPETLGQASDGGVPGILVSPEDPAAISAGLRRWFGDPGLRRRLRLSALDRRDRLAPWQETARGLAAVLERLRGVTR